MPQKKKPEMIFKDRRVNPGNATISDDDAKYKHCRRGSDFSESESLPWWLKVNYVSQHLQSAGPKDP